jgi:transketolase
MTVVAPADAEEMRRFMPLTLDYPGPIYIRLAKGGDPVVTDARTPFEIGKAYPLHEGNDGLIITTGITTKVGLDAAAILGEKGVNVTVLHVPTIKPLDEDAIRSHAERVPAIVTVEEHSLIGGLGSAVAEVLMEANFSTPKRFKRSALPDQFPDKYGSQNSLLQRYNITAESTAKSLLHLLEVETRSLN